MQIEYPDYYNKFHCLAGDCPDTCCRDWEVDVDDDTFYYYKVQEGELGAKLGSFLREEGELKYIPMKKDGFCPFLTEGKLCELCCRLGEEGMCQVCQEYPRYYMGIGHYEQIDLSLSCMEVGRLLFTGAGPIRYEKSEDEEEPWETLSDKEQEKLEEILKLRDAMVASLQQEDEAGEPCICILPGEEADQTLLGILPELEILDAESGRILKEIEENYGTIREREPEFRRQYEDLLKRLFTRFAVYLVFRYTLDSYYEGNLDAEKQLWERSLRLMLLMCVNEERKAGAFGVGTMIQLAHRFSRQIEHSDENMEKMKAEKNPENGREAERATENEAGESLV